MFIIPTQREQYAAASLADDPRFRVITAWIAANRKEAESALLAASDTVMVHRMQGCIDVLDTLLGLEKNTGTASRSEPVKDNSLHF